MRYIPTQQPTEAVYKDQQERVDGEESSGSRVIAASDYYVRAFQQSRRLVALEENDHINALPC